MEIIIQIIVGAFVIATLIGLFVGSDDDLDLGFGLLAALLAWVQLTAFLLVAYVVIHFTVKYW